MSTNYENQCKVFGQTIVHCCRFKSCSATCCKTPSVSSTFSQILQSVVTELLRDTFNLCSRHLVLRYLHSVFSASCSYTPSVCFLGTVYWHMFYMCYQQSLLRNFQCVFSVTCSYKSLSLSSQLPLLTHFLSVLNTVLRDTLFSDNVCTSTYPLNMTHGLSKSRLLAMCETHLYLLT
jgi:hypothetical protein